MDFSCSFILITWQAVQNCVTWKWRKSFSFSLKLPMLYSKHESLVSFMLANTVFISCLGYSNFSAMIYSCFSTIIFFLAIKRCRNNLILLCMYVPNKYSEANYYYCVISWHKPNYSFVAFIYINHKNSMNQIKSIQFSWKLYKRFTCLVSI